MPFSAQLRLLRELDDVQKMMWQEFQPTQLNVAAIGNKTPQLHIHVIARYESDPAWPGTVWDHPVRCPYDEAAKSALLAKLKLRLRQASACDGFHLIGDDQNDIPIFVGNTKGQDL